MGNFISIVLGVFLGNFIYNYFVEEALDNWLNKIEERKISNG